jgi:tRNA nucleotidyltransferase (CCA-adding enzyme)
MKFYRVGGCVRDALLGEDRRRRGDLDAALETDRDWVAVGGTVDEMIARGFRPVGKDFPVFLHPETNEEYALARTERKTAPGYRGFVFHAAPDVTLEADLARRDLTINAMALDEDGRLIDPHNGARDLRAGVLRHVGPAFIEDPVRILRLARFAARFPDFRVAPETAELVREMVRNGEADALVAERVMQEISRGLMERKPSRMLEVLVASGLVDRLYSELEDLPAAAAALDRAAERGLVLPARFAVLASACRSPRTVADLIGKLRVPQEAAQLARLLVELRDTLGAAESSATIVEALERSDAFRRPERFELLLQAFEVAYQTSAERFRRALQAASEVDAGALASLHRFDAAEIPRAVRQARIVAISRALHAGTRESDGGGSGQAGANGDV